MKSVKEELKRFCETTSIRGIPRIPRSKETIVKVMWILMVILCLAVLITFLLVIVQKFNSWPVATEFKEDLDDVLDFPDVTICSLNRFLNNYRGNVSIETHFESIGNIKDNYVTRLTYKTLGSFIRSLPKNEFFAGDDCPPFIADCIIYSKDYVAVNNCQHNFTRIWNSESHSCYTIRTNTIHDYPIRGMTLLLNVGPPSTIQIPYELNIVSKQSNGIRVMIHSPGTSPNNKIGFDLSPGTENTIKIVQTNKIRVNRPYNLLGCMKQEIMPNSTSEKYSLHQCLEYCAQYIIYKRCNCVVYWYSIPESLENIKVCGNMSVPEEIEAYIKVVDELICGMEDIINKSGCFSECLIPCQEQLYEKYVVSSSWPSEFQQVGIYQSYFKRCIKKFPEVKKRYAAYEYFSKQQSRQGNVSKLNYSVKDLKEIGQSLLVVKFVIEEDFPFVQINKPLYTWEVMTGLIGGQLSLWLGVSAMTIAEVIEFIYKIAKQFSIKCFSPKENEIVI